MITEFRTCLDDLTMCKAPLTISHALLSSFFLSHSYIIRSQENIL